MKMKGRWMGVAAMALYTLTFACVPCRACLRDSLDDRAVQWSTEIAVAKLLAVHDPQPLGPSDNLQYQTYDFQVVTPFDGPAKAGEKLPVVRFIVDSDSQKSSICGQSFTDRQIGKDFLLLLRPEASLAWNDRGGADPRTPELHALKAFLVVHVESSRDLGPEGLDDAKYTVTSTRAAEAQIKPADVKLQAQTMIDAADDTEESQAQHALEEMGFKAAPVLKELASQADEAARTRLQRVIRAISPPSIMGSIHQH